MHKAYGMYYSELTSTHARRSMDRSTASIICATLTPASKPVMALGAVCDGFGKLIKLHRKSVFIAQHMSNRPERACIAVTFI